jgi:hypothetical protein
VLFACSAVLLLAGVASGIWEAQSLSPDILGFASSVARHSRYVKDVPGVDTTMSGAERARALGGRGL